MALTASTIHRRVQIERTNFIFWVKRTRLLFSNNSETKNAKVRLNEWGIRWWRRILNSFFNCQKIYPPSGWSELVRETFEVPRSRSNFFPSDCFSNLKLLAWFLIFEVRARFSLGGGFSLLNSSVHKRPKSRRYCFFQSLSLSSRKKKLRRDPYSAKACFSCLVHLREHMLDFEAREVFE